MISPCTGDSTSRVVLRSTPFTTDLLTLVDSITLLFGDSEIYASSPTYAALPAGAVVTGSLQMPSLAQSGLNVNLPGDALVIAADGSASLVVDFDVAQSFGRLAGASGRWVMTPVRTGFVPNTTP